jgi:hypothetical protein
MEKIRVQAGQHQYEIRFDSFYGRALDDLANVPYKGNFELYQVHYLRSQYDAPDTVCLPVQTDELASKEQAISDISAAYSTQIQILKTQGERRYRLKLKVLELNLSPEQLIESPDNQALTEVDRELGSRQRDAIRLKNAWVILNTWHQIPPTWEN